MSIVNGEEAAFGPIPVPVLVGRLCHIEYNAYPVFIIVSLHTLMGVGCVTGDYAVLLRGELGLLKVAQRVRHLSLA